jgi:hypothetical protein
MLMEDDFTHASIEQASGHRATIEAEHRACIEPASSHSIEQASSFQHRASRPGLRIRNTKRTSFSDSLSGGSKGGVHGGTSVWFGKNVYVKCDIVINRIPCKAKKSTLMIP